VATARALQWKNQNCAVSCIVQGFVIDWNCWSTTESSLMLLVTVQIKVTLLTLWCYCWCDCVLYWHNTDWQSAVQLHTVCCTDMILTDSQQCSYTLCAVLTWYWLTVSSTATHCVLYWHDTDWQSAVQLHIVCCTDMILTDSQKYSYTLCCTDTILTDSQQYRYTLCAVLTWYWLIVSSAAEKRNMPTSKLSTVWTSFVRSIQPLTWPIYFAQ
jgi:hypothetical protein